MPFDRTVKDEDILAGFTSLHQAMAEGFDKMSRQLEVRFQAIEHQILDVRNDVARLETRILRRFDEVDARFDKLEARVTRLEERIA
jgi:hypothetical protein